MNINIQRVRRHTNKKLHWTKHEITFFWWVIFDLCKRGKTLKKVGGDYVECIKRLGNKYR